MFRTKTCKIMLVCACLMAILLPYATPVLAAARYTPFKQTDLADGATLTLVNTTTYENGFSYDFQTSDGKEKNTYKICVLNEGNGEKDYNYSNAIYCVDGNKIFPTAEGTLFKNFGDFFAEKEKRSPELKSYVEEISEDNYKAICWLAENMYLKHQDDEKNTQYDNFISKVFGEYIKLTEEKFPDAPTTVEDIKAEIDFDDIEAVQQYAIWYFSDDGYLKIEENADVKSASGYAFEKALDPKQVKVAYKMSALEILDGQKPVSQEGLRFAYLDMLFSYLVTNAKSAIQNNTDKAIVKLPEFDNSVKAVAEVEDSNYKIGPFKISETNSSDYKITLTDGEKELTKYTIKNVEGKELGLQEVAGNEFYIYVPTTEKITSVRLGLEYSGAVTNVSFWKKVDDKTNEFQPVILITKDNKAPQYIDVLIEESDLALRKYIVSVNGDKSVARTPKVDATGLVKSENPAKTAIYKHKKSPIEVSSGDKIVYEIRVYNEGKTSASVKKITDFIPSGLELVDPKESEINSKYKWTVANGVATIDLNVKLNKIDANKINAEKDTITGGLDSTAVQIELKVKDGLNSDAVLTNVAEITDDSILDRDSNTGSVKKDSINENTFSGNKDNKDNLDDPNNFYKGIEDDDDFEKVKIEGKVFDLAFKKFITSVNGEKQSREPKVDVSSLATTTNAKYTTVKTPLVVEQGDIVTYKIRVYNEGEMNAYAEEIAEYIPEGLGFIVNHKVNDNNYWSISDAIKAGAKSVQLSSIKNATKNVKLEDFVNTKSLDEVEVVKGVAKLKSTKLSYSVNSSNLIKGFDIEKDKTLAYKDIEIACVVLVDEVTDTNLKNIAEISKDSTPGPDGKPEEVVDRDSEPDTVNPDDYPGKDKNQDDHDFEDLTIEDYVYDLALQKFITAVDDEKVTDRTPSVTLENGKIRYNHSTEPKELGNGDLVEYTIRVYNEGTRAAYAAEVADDLPNGLKFVADNETNVEYGWVLVDKYGEETNDINQAKTVRTDYLSKDASEKREEDCLIKAFDPTKPISTDANNPNPDYRDVKIVFEVDESVLDKSTTTELRIIENTAEITDMTDEDGDYVQDEDSIPDNWKNGEDDIDREKIYIKYFDLSLQKDLVKVIVIENGNVTEYSVNDDQLFKVEIHKKKIKSTVVKFVYNITVKNEGEIDGYAKEIKDYIPEGLEFVSDDNQGWYKLSDNTIATDALANTLLKANGGTASVQVTLKWINGENNLNKKDNIAEISKDDNEYDSPDIDSTPDNKVPGEDDIDNAPVILSISTGAGETYYGLITVIAVIMITGIALIKKYVL